MKILDRYISSAVAAAFFSGLMVFLVLLCAMSLFPGFIKLVTTYNIPQDIALRITAYKIPSMLVYAFPMAVLLGILLVFARMSAESEMVAIRAAGVSFVRITLPVLIFSLLVSGLTFLISNYYAPYASETSAALERVAMQKVKSEMVTYSRKDQATGKLVYTIQAAKIETTGSGGTMQDVTVVYYADGVPNGFVYAPRATFDARRGAWAFEGDGRANPLFQFLGQQVQGLNLQPGVSSTTRIALPAEIAETPFFLKHQDDDPAEMTSAEINRQVAEMRAQGLASPRDLGKWLTRLAQRYSTPFACLVFALIGSPLGLRHHRTSSAVGFGISLVVIFAFYFVNIYISSLGDSGALSPLVSAWFSNVLGAALGIVLLLRANR